MKTVMLCAVLVVMASTPCLAQSSGEGVDPASHEARERELAYQLAPVKSEADLRTYLARNQSRDSPLNLLSPGARQRFVQSLVFTDKGLASFDYRDIRAELTATQAYQLLSLFGAQRSTKAIPGMEATTPADATIMWDGGDGVITDYEDFACHPPATCRRETGAICIGENC